MTVHFPWVPWTPDSNKTQARHKWVPYWHGVFLNPGNDNVKMKQQGPPEAP